MPRVCELTTKSVLSRHLMGLPILRSYILLIYKAWTSQSFTISNLYIMYLIVFLVVLGPSSLQLELFRLLLFKYFLLENHGYTSNIQNEMLLGCCIYKRPKRIISNLNSTLLRHPVHTGIIIFSHCYKPKVRQRNEYFASLTFVVGAACLPHLALMTVDYFFVFVLLLLCLVLYSVAFSLLRPPPLIHSVTGIRSID